MAEVSKDGWPEHFQLIPRTVERIANVAYGVGYLLAVHLLWDTKGRASSHRRVPEVGDDQHERELLSEWRKQDLAHDIEHQLRIPYDSEGSYHHLEG